MAGAFTSSGATFPFIDLRPSHASIKLDLLERIGVLIDAGMFTGGPQVAEFEQAFASFTGVHHCVGVASGLDALRLALLATEIEPGDEVIVPANTFPATVEAITQARGVPLLVDASESDYNIDPAAAASAVTSRTRIPSSSTPLRAAREYACSPARRRQVRACRDRRFLPGTRRLSRRHQPGNAHRRSGVQLLSGEESGRDGRCRRDRHEQHRRRGGGAGAARARSASEIRARAGGVDGAPAPSKLSSFLHKLPLMDAWTGQRRAAAAWYLEQLRATGDVILPPVPTGSEPVWHLFVIRTAHVQELGAYLETRGIATGRHYPTPIHLTAAFQTPGAWIGRVSGVGASCS